MTRSNSAWLKILRANEHLGTLKQRIEADSSRNLDEILSKSNGEPTLDLPEPDFSIAVLADEIIYHLRSALDHLAFDLVQQNRSGITLPAKWEENCAFPLWTTLKPGQTPPLPYGVFGNLPGIPKEAHTIIEGVQPYYGPGVRAVNNLTRFMVALSNINKHRRFALTRPRAMYSVYTKLESGRNTSASISLEHGAEIPADYIPGGSDRIVNVDRSVSLFVAFNERDALGDATDVRIEYLLELMLVSVIIDIHNPLRAIIAR